MKSHRKSILLSKTKRKADDKKNAPEKVDGDAPRQRLDRPMRRRADGGSVREGAKELNSTNAIGAGLGAIVAGAGLRGLAARMAVRRMMRGESPLTKSVIGAGTTGMATQGAGVASIGAGVHGFGSEKAEDGKEDRRKRGGKVGK